MILSGVGGTHLLHNPLTSDKLTQQQLDHYVTTPFDMLNRCSSVTDVNMIPMNRPDFFFPYFCVRLISHAYEGVRASESW